jgi:hypothetical protein
MRSRTPTMLHCFSRNRARRILVIIAAEHKSARPSSLKYLHTDPKMDTPTRLLNGLLRAFSSEPPLTTFVPRSFACQEILLRNADWIRTRILRDFVPGHFVSEDNRPCTFFSQKHPPKISGFDRTSVHPIASVPASMLPGTTFSGLTWLKGRSS